MNKIIVIVTLIPWVLYYISLTRNNMIILKDKHNLLSNFTIKELIFTKNILLFVLFISISVIYSDSNQIELVNSLLFSTINIFLFIYSYYEYQDNELDLSIKDKINIIILSIIVFIITVISLFIDNILIIYNILFALSILNIILLYISRKIISIVRRINNEIKQL